MTGRMLFVESNTTGTGMLALAAARRLGLVPVLLTSRPDRYRGLAEVAPELVTCDTNDAAALAAAVRRYPRADLAGVTTTSEFYLLAAARLADRLGLSGNPPEVIRVCRDKAQVRHRLAAGGLVQPQFAVLRHPAEVTTAVRRIGFPCVVKPVDDSGSQNVRICLRPSDVRAQVARIVGARTNVRGQPAAGVALVEEYLDGPEFSVETFTRDGTVHCVGVTAKWVGGLPYFVESRHLYPAPLRVRGILATMTATVRRVLGVLGIRHGPAHTEVRVLGRRVAVVEVNARLAGGMIPELVRLVDGIDLIEQQVRAAAGRPVELVAARRGYAGIEFLTARSAGVLTRIRGTAAAAALPGIARVAVTADPGTAVRPPQNAYDRLGYVVARGDTPGVVLARLAAARQRIDISVAPPTPARRPVHDRSA